MKEKSPRDAASRPQVTAGGSPSVTAGHGAKGAAIRERAIIALLNESTILLAARRSGISERTLRRWIAEDTPFQSALQAARRANFQNAMDRIQAGTERAVLTLEALLAAKQPPHVRLNAARTILEIGIQRHDADTILRRLRDLEQAQDAGATGRSSSGRR